MPIQRHESLASLSRDHHLALLLARGIQTPASKGLRAALPSGPRALADHVCRVFRDELDAHFAAEEEEIFPAIIGRDATLDAMIEDIAAEHVAMHELVDALGDRSLDDVTIEQTLDRLGRLLEAHVRKEERSFYQRIQEVLDPAALANLGNVLERHLSAVPYERPRREASPSNSTNL